MSKWHNGPNGPGICRAKAGNCPFGGEESHFDSREEAEKDFNKRKAKEYGILPEVNAKDMAEDNEGKRFGVLRGRGKIPFGDGETHFSSKGEAERALDEQFGTMMSEIDGKDNWETKVAASNSSGNSVSLSNYVKMSGKGDAHDANYIQAKLKEAGMDSDKMIDSLNNDDNIHGEWKLKEETADKITLENKDAFGNMSYLNVSKVSPKKNKSQVGKISSKGMNGASMSLSNYVDSESGGNKEAQEYFESKIASANMDSEKMVRYLNADKRIFGKWSLESEDDNQIKLKNEEFGNTSYIFISKEFEK